MLTNRKQDVIDETKTWSSSRGAPESEFRDIGPTSARKPVASVRPPVTARRSQTPLPATQPTSFEPLLDLHEASAVLGMHWKTLEAKARGREVPAFKVGKRWRFRLSSLDSWLERGKNSNATDHAVATRQGRCS